MLNLGFELRMIAGDGVLKLNRNIFDFYLVGRSTKPSSSRRYSPFFVKWLVSVSRV